ncbi:PTS system N-acetylgalactosamine-specific EIIC component 1 [Klebsiella pneumoniae]|nr:PTS system N-acetylgalactosamine-specific EIIC component 1 [Klebsiella pneumoniae]
MHEITLLQGLSLAALVFVLGIDFWLEALFLFRPGNDSNLLIVFYVQIMPDDLVMQLHRF